MDGEASSCTAPGPAALHGIRVLDLSSVGPGARASRILSDYGAEVVKVAPVPASGAEQIVPPFYAYSGQRLCKRVCIDLKAPAGRQAFLGLAASSDVLIESFRPGVAGRLGRRWSCPSAENMAATRTRLISAVRRDSITSPAPHSGCPWRGLQRLIWR